MGRIPPNFMSGYLSCVNLQCLYPAGKIKESLNCWAALLALVVNQIGDIDWRADFCEKGDCTICWSLNRINCFSTALAVSVRPSWIELCSWRFKCCFMDSWFVQSKNSFWLIGAAWFGIFADFKLLGMTYNAWNILYFFRYRYLYLMHSVGSGLILAK